MTADEESDALVTPMIQEREDATVPQDVDHRPPARARREDMLPPLHAVAPCRREQAHEPGHERRHQRLGPAELHPASSRARAATRSAAPGGPNRCRTSPSPSRWRRAASLSGSSHGSTASAKAAGVTAPCSSSGLTSRPAIRFTSPTWGTCSMRMAMANDTGLRRYAMTMGTSASAASSVVVPDLQRPASAAENTAGGRHPAPGPVRLPLGHRPAVFSAADAGLCKSGTTTLEAALADVPMVIAYRLNPVSFAIAIRMLQVPHVGLVNLIAGRE